MKKHTSLLAALALCAMGSMVLMGATPAPEEEEQQKPKQPPPVQQGQQTQQPSTQPAPQKRATAPQTRMQQPPGDAMAVYKARSAMRQVWGEHLVYTRNYIISVIDDLNDAEVVSNRLFENAADIGNTLQPYYGNTAAQKLTTLMREHVMIVAQLARVASGEDLGNSPVARGVSSSDRTGTNGSTDRNMGGSTGSSGPNGYASANNTKPRVMDHDVDKDQLSEVQRRLETNGKDIASFLGGLNPNWKTSDVEGMMANHVQEMIDQITARASADWPADIQAFDQSMDHVFQFADMLSSGIERQFPDRFNQAVN